MSLDVVASVDVVVVAAAVVVAVATVVVAIAAVAVGDAVVIVVVATVIVVAVGDAVIVAANVVVVVVVVATVVDVTFEKKTGLVIILIANQSCHSTGRHDYFLTSLFQLFLIPLHSTVEAFLHPTQQPRVRNPAPLRLTFFLLTAQFVDSIEIEPI